MFWRRITSDDAGQALAELYTSHADAVFRYAYHLTGRREDAEDLVQVTFLEAQRVLSASGRLVTPRAWLMTTVKRRALNLRRDSHEIPASDRVDLLTQATAVDAVSAAHEQLDRVRAALWSLPEQQHQAFVLRHWSGLSYREIADVLDTSESAVESLLVRARETVAGERELDDSCLEVRRRLSLSRRLAPRHNRHIASCGRCRTAQSRLAHAAGAAAVLTIVTNAEVAQALAASVPGFTGGGLLAGGGAGGGVSAAGAAGGVAVAGEVAAGGSLLSAAGAAVAIKTGVAVIAAGSTLAIAEARGVIPPISPLSDRASQKEIRGPAGDNGRSSQAPGQQKQHGRPTASALPPKAEGFGRGGRNGAGKEKGDASGQGHGGTADANGRGGGKGLGKDKGAPSQSHGAGQAKGVGPPQSPGQAQGQPTHGQGQSKDKEDGKGNGRGHGTDSATGTD